MLRATKQPHKFVFFLNHGCNEFTSVVGNMRGFAMFCRPIFKLLTRRLFCSTVAGSALSLTSPMIVTMPSAQLDVQVWLLHACPRASGRSDTSSSCALVAPASSMWKLSSHWDTRRPRHVIYVRVLVYMCVCLFCVSQLVFVEFACHFRGHEGSLTCHGVFWKACARFTSLGWWTIAGTLDATVPRFPNSRHPKVISWEDILCQPWTQEVKKWFPGSPTLVCTWCHRTRVGFPGSIW